MPRGMVGLLAAVAAAMAVLDPLAHGYLAWLVLAWLVLAIVAAAAGLVGYTTAPDLTFPTVPALPSPVKKKISQLLSKLHRGKHLSRRSM
jgi:hypothetical protein